MYVIYKIDLETSGKIWKLREKLSNNNVPCQNYKETNQQHTIFEVSLKEKDNLFRI